VINCLLDNGADVNKLNDDGVSSLVISFFNLYPVSVFTETSRAGTLTSQQQQLTKCAVCLLDCMVCRPCVSLYTVYRCVSLLDDVWLPGAANNVLMLMYFLLLVWCANFVLLVTRLFE